MKLLIIADIHNKYKKLDDIIEKADKEVDVILCPGDFTDMFDIPSGFEQIDIASMVLQKLLSLKKPLLCVPGNHDPYEILELFDEMGVNLHAKNHKISNLTFSGFGGAATPFNTLFEPTDQETADALSKLNPDILLVHAPPFNTVCDRLPSGENVGSKPIRSFIEKKQPMLAICAHIHEAAGQDKIGKTTVFYPGPAYDGFYGIVSIEGKEVKCQVKKA